MVVLSEFALLLLGCIIKWVLDSGLDGLKASHAEWSESYTSVLSSHADTINGSLSNSWVFRASVAANLLDYLWVQWT